MSTIAVNAITDASGGSAASINGYTPSASNMAGRNRIINGDMRIDQRNNGAAVTPTTTTYTLDRWRAGITVGSKFSVQQNAGSVTPPAGFTNYLGVTSLSAYSVASGDILSVQQFIEGFNVSDLGWGTVNAQPVTLSFKVYSSLTGTFGGALSNNDGDRSYPFAYTVASANTWTNVSITIPGDTTGTWLTNNLIGIQLRLGLGVGSTFSGTAGAWASANIFAPTGSVSVVGTNGATFYITGVQLEAGSVATSFEHRQYGQELALCQRYFQSYTIPMLRGVFSASTSFNRVGMSIPTMRGSPAFNSSGTFDIYDGTNSGTVTSFNVAYSRVNSIELDGNPATGTFTAGRPCIFFVGGNTGVMTLSAEL